jgi:hypothetical protein
MDSEEAADHTQRGLTQKMRVRSEMNPLSDSESAKICVICGPYLSTDYADFRRFKTKGPGLQNLVRRENRCLGMIR